MANHLFLASTPFNVVTASMIALQLHPQETCELWLIDQPTDNSSFIKGLYSWEDSPFREIRIVSRQAKTFSEKRKRKHTLRALTREAKSSGITDLYTANDRRIEFQWLMAHLPSSVTGHYVDDGTYSYIGRKTHWFSDRVIDNLLKKLMYGLWWKQPKTIGASEWIKIVHLAFPKLAVSELHKKECRQVPDELSNPALTSLGATFGDEVSEATKLDALIVLPHESVRSEKTEQSLLHEGNKYSFCGIKRHPRSATGSMNIQDMKEISAKIPFELLLSNLKPGCCIIGDVSSALLTARWLSPHLHVVCLADRKDNLTALMEKIGIEVRYI